MTTNQVQLADNKGTRKGPPRSDPLLAEHIMTPTVIAVEPSESLRKVANLLLSNEISGVPVLGEDGEVIGIVTEADLMAKEEGTDPLARNEPLFTIRNKTKRFFQAYKGLTAGDAMTSPVITASPDTQVRELAASMRKNGINAIPIVVKGKIKGIVSRRDVLKVFMRSDPDLRRAVVAKLKQLRAYEPQVEITVEDGIVVLKGVVSTRSKVERLEAAVRSIDSVIGVDLSSLQFERDDITIEYRGF